MKKKAPKYLVVSFLIYYLLILVKLVLLALAAHSYSQSL